MKYSLAIASLFAAIVSAQTTQLPQCAQTCALNAIGSSDGCTVTDAACLCQSQGYLTSFTTCVESTCDAADQEAAATFGTAYCASAGVTITSTPGATATATDAAASSSAASSVSEGASSISASIAESSSVSSKSVSSSIASVSSSLLSSASAGPHSAASSASAAAGAAPTQAVHAWEMMGLGAAAVAAAALL